MSPLPIDRVTPFYPPFTFVGVDYFGPFLVSRGRSMVKRYGCLFTCLTIRAIHIEVAHSLDSSSFIDALERFISRRGRPRVIRSDNGANKELKEAIQDWNQDNIAEHLKQKEITWIFNPPYASHMGGVWERQIRSVRRIMMSLIKQQTLTDESICNSCARLRLL